MIPQNGERAACGDPSFRSGKDSASCGNKLVLGAHFLLWGHHQLLAAAAVLFHEVDQAHGTGVAHEFGGIGALHHHTEHEQVGLITSGRFEVTVGDSTRVLGPGDSYYAAKNTPHGVRALEDGTIIDAFTPLRRDFLPV